MNDYFPRELSNLQRIYAEVEKENKLRRDIEAIVNPLRMLGIDSLGSSSEQLIRVARGIHDASVLKSIPHIDPHLLQVMDNIRKQEELRNKYYIVPDAIDKTWIAREIERNLAIHTGPSLLVTQAQLELESTRFQSAWLNGESRSESIKAFVTFGNMSAAINLLSPFCDELASTLRSVLGDWRAPITLPGDYFVDVPNRIDFYVQRGYDTTVADVPSDAFDERMEFAGFLGDDDPLAFDGAPDSVSVQRTSDAQYRLLCFEIQIRGFIQGEMLKTVGEKWMKERVPGDMRKEWLAKQERRKERNETAIPFFDNADFGHYVDIICRTDNWNEIFKQFFIRQEHVREFFNKMIPVRNAACHGGLIVQDDWVMMRVTLKQFRKLIS